MLLLVTILLVLIAAVTLLIGIFSDNLALIFVSIGASAVAAIVLAVLSQVSKRKGREAIPATGPEPLPAREPATVGASRQAEQAVASIADVGEPVGAVVAADAPTTSMTAVGSSALPIAGYDTMRVNEILPALEDLDLDQLETIAQHEESSKNRTTVLNRIDDLMDELEAQEAGGAPAPATDVAVAAVESIEDIGEPVVAVAAADDGFPIPDYDDLDEAELIARLAELDADQLEAVADREEAGSNRDAVLDAIDDRLDVLEGIVPAPAAAAVAATKAPAKKAPAKKTVTKAPAKVAAATRTASKAPARKAATTPPSATRKAAAPAPAKRSAPVAAKKSAPAPAKRSAPVAAKKATTPTRKSTAAPAKRTAATKAPAKKAVSAAKATKKAATTAKKAAPVKKATAAKKSSKR